MFPLTTTNKYITILFFLFLSSVSCQYCELYAYDHHPYTFNLCDTIISQTNNNNNIFITDNNHTQEITDSYYLSSPVRASLFWPKFCSSLFLNVVCRVGYPECVYNAFPVFPCASMCWEMVGVCAPYLESLGPNLPLNCSQLPVGDTEYIVNGTVISIPCSTTPVPEHVDTHMAECPEPLHNSETKDTDLHICELECPFSAMKEGDMDGRQKILDATLPFSYCATILIGILYFWIPAKRKFPQLYKGNVLLAALGITVAASVSVFGRIENITCTSKTTLATQDHGPCGFQAVLFTYFGMACSMWWTITSVNVLFMLTYPTKRDALQSIEKFVLIFGWGFPFLFTIVGLSKKKYGTFVTSTFCVVDDSDDKAWSYGLFYIPLCVQLFLGFASWSAIVYKIFSTEKANRRYSTASSSKRYKHIIYFTALGLYLYSVVIAERFNFSYQYPGVEDDINEWIACVVRQFVTLGNTKDCDRPDFTTLVHFENFFHFTVGSLGFVTAAVCATESEFLNYWKFRFFGKGEDVESSPGEGRNRRPTEEQAFRGIESEPSSPAGSPKVGFDVRGSY